MNYVNWRIN